MHDTRRDSTASRLILFGPVALFVVCLLVIVEKTSAPLGNADTWFHLRLGQEFSGKWSLTDPGSVSTFGTRHWLPTEWLGELTMYAFDKAFGLPGVAWLAGALVLAYALAIYLTARRCAEPLCAVLVTALAVAASAGGLSARPQVWSYLLVVVTAGAWLRTGEDLKARWWLVPLTWAWAMLHGMWVLGPTIGTVAALAIALDQRHVRTGLRLAAVPLASLLAAALTPVGPRLYAAVFTVGSRAWYFTEWQPTSFRTSSAIIGSFLVVIPLIVYSRRGGARWLDLGLLLLAAGWLAYAIRTVPAGAAIAAPAAARALQLVLERKVPLGRGEKRVVIGAFLAALALLAALVPLTARHPGDWRPRLDFALDRLPAGTTVLNDDTLGGWIEWRHPDLNIVIDGYVDQYPSRWMYAYRNAVEVQPGWQNFVRQSGAQYAILYEGAPLQRALVTGGWRVAGRQKDVMLMRAPES